MKHTRSISAVIAFSAAVTATQWATAQEKPANASTRIPVRMLTAPLAVSRDTFKLVTLVREFEGKRVLVNDAMGHRLVLLDTLLSAVRVVFDTIPGRDNYYGQRPEPVIPFLGDSTLFIDHQSRTLLLIEPSGKVGRTIAAPNDPGLFVAVATAAGTDDRGRVLYRGLDMSDTGKPGQPGLMVLLNGALPPTSNADSNPIVRGDLNTRTVDTIAALRSLNANRAVQSKDANGVTTRLTYLNPRPVGDEWTVVSDGTIAIVRGHDYHIDWITSDGRKSSTDKLPMDWKRITDAEKVRLRDSTLNTMSRTDSIEQIIAKRMAEGGGGGARVSTGRADDAQPPSRMVNKTTSVALNDIPDYEPAIRQGAVIADRDNNVWILPRTSAQSLQGELVYDVVNRKGELFERVRLPLGRSIIGFGRGGVVYLLSGNLTRGFQVERTRVVF